MILYIYKIIIGLCPNPGLNRIPLSRSTALFPKRNRRSSTWLRNIRHTSFYSRAPELFNTLPHHLRNVVLPEIPSKKNVEEYKKQLDKYLWRIPDQPTVANLTQGRAAASNSLLHQTRYIRPDTGPKTGKRSRWSDSD